MDQKEFFIQKALGWALRSYAYTNRAWVQDFVGRHSQRLSNLAIREALKHVGKGGKEKQQGQEGNSSSTSSGVNNKGRELSTGRKTRTTKRSTTASGGVEERKRRRQS